MSNSRSSKYRGIVVLALIAAALLAPLAASALLHTVRPMRVSAMPRPQVVEGPARRTTMRTAQFVLRDRARGARFECSLDGAPFRRCSVRPRYGVSGTPAGCPTDADAAADDTGRCEATELRGIPVRDGGHVLHVKAIGIRGQRSPTTAYHWTIVPEVSFTLTLASSPAPPQLYPGGPALAIPLVIGNPSDQTLYVERLVVTASTDSASCPAASNLRIATSNVSRRRPIRVGAHAQVTLPADGVTAPTVRMLELAVNQDGCKGASVKLHYAGDGHA